MGKRQFTYASGRVWVLETRLLDRQKMERLMEAQSVDDFWRLLSETDYAGGINASNYLEEEAIFQKRRVSARNLLLESAAEEPLLHVFLWRDDLHNLKVMLKERVMRLNLEHLYVDAGFYPAGELKKAWESADANMAPWIVRALDYLKTALSKGNPDLARADLALDRFYFDYAAGIMQNSLYEHVAEIWKRTVDAHNLKNIIRAKNLGLNPDQWLAFYLPGGHYMENDFLKLYNSDKEGLRRWLQNSKIARLAAHGGEKAVESPVYAETAADNYIFTLWHERRSDPFQPVALVSYLLSVEQEVKMLRLILAGKRNGLPLDEIRERMRLVI
ncbi:MAG: V-type ATPase subunit [Bacillota bacterium]